MSGIPKDTILNFRDFGGYEVEGGATVAKGQLFRGALLYGPKQEGITALGQNLGVKTWIDFRSQRERRKDSLISGVTDSPVLRNGRFVNRAQQPPVELERILVEFDIERLAFGFFLANAPWWKSLMILICFVLCLKHRIRLMLLEFVNSAQMGVVAFYKMLVDYAQPQLLTVLKAYVEAPGAVFVNCALGKDRTGITVALVQLALGVSEEDIINEYFLTETYLDEKHRYGEMERLGFNPHTWGNAPKEVMRQFLDYIKQKYGSSDKFFDYIGFDASWRLKLKQKFLVQKQTH